MQQLRGGFSSDLKELRHKLIDLASLIELELDFGEEDVEFASRDDLKETIQSLIDKVTRLKESFETGNAIKNGIRTVIAGKPNAGKSTLLNALLNSDRAIVSPIPGTTRDSIEDILIIGGVKFILIDTAGLRVSEDDIEEEGVKRSLKHIGNSQITIFVIDVCTESPESVWQALSELDVDICNSLLVLNKMDLHPTADPRAYVKEGVLNYEQIVPLSAKNHMNVLRLQEVMKGLINTTSIQDSTIVTNVRHFDSLNETLVAITRCLDGIQQGRSGDLLAMDLRHALHHLGEITGEIHSDDLLDNIFSNFCIGK